MMICCVGQAAYDITAYMDGDIAPDTKYRIDEHAECAGAPALNAACVCARWGMDAWLVARVGQDAFGGKVLSSLKKYQVRTDLMIDDPAATTSVSLIVANRQSGERTILNFPEYHGQAFARLPAVVPDVILSDGHEPEASHAYVAAFPDVPHVIDAGTCRQDTLDVAREADYLIASRPFAEQYLGRALNVNDAASLSLDLMRICSIAGGCEVVVTLGDQGLVYLEQEQARMLPAFFVRAVDSTGAGDIFHGAFAFGIASGLSLKDSLVLASMTSAISVTRRGGQASIPTLAEVREQLAIRGAGIGSGGALT